MSFIKDIIKPVAWVASLYGILFYNYMSQEHEAKIKMRENVQQVEQQRKANDARLADYNIQRENELKERYGEKWKDQEPKGILRLIAGP